MLTVSLQRFKTLNLPKTVVLGTIDHHHYIAPVARISLTLSRHSSLSFIALGRSSGQHPVSSHSCWMYVRAGRPAFAGPCVGVHKSTSLMRSSLLLQQCPACLVRLTLGTILNCIWWKSRECGVPLHCHYCQVNFDPDGCTCEVSSIGLIDLLENPSYSIGPCAKKKKRKKKTFKNQLL